LVVEVARVAVGAVRAAAVVVDVDVAAVPRLRRRSGFPSRSWAAS